MERAISVLAEAATRQLDFNKQIASAVIGKGKQGYPDFGEETNPVPAQMTNEAREIYRAADMILKGKDGDGDTQSSRCIGSTCRDWTDERALSSRRRQAAMDRARNYPTRIREAALADPRLREAITTSTSGGAMGISGAPPIVLVMSDILANLRDTVQNVDIAGEQTARFSAMTVPSFGSLSRTPSRATFRRHLRRWMRPHRSSAGEQNVTYSAQQKFVGDVLAAVTMAFQIAAIVHADGKILSALDTATAGNSYTQTIYSDAGVASTVNARRQSTAPTR